MARAGVIDAARLETLAGDPNIKSGDIAQIFGVGRATFFHYLSNHEELWNVYANARLRAGKQVTKAHLLPSRRGSLNVVEITMLEVIALSQAHTYSAIREAAIAAGIEPRQFSGLRYNLEHEKHEIESFPEGDATHYQVRQREAKKGKAA
jgi:hypothetical protein